LRLTRDNQDPPPLPMTASTPAIKISSERESKSHLGALFVPLDFLLASGGDARLRVDPTERLNGYGCRPFPRPEAFTFASSTATSISERAYARARDARKELIEASLSLGLVDAFDACVEQMRGKLKKYLQLGDETEIVFSPSGTDSQLHALFMARALLGVPLISAVVAADQTGGGTKHTATGCHFGDRTAQGVAVEKGSPISGLAADAASIGIPLCDENGTPRSLNAIDAEIIDAISKAIESGNKILLQIMNSSKLGWHAPSRDCVKEICARWPDAVQIVVDACQMRLSSAQIKHHLSCGHMVLTTGSKFFTGPPFSGALLVPGRISRRLEGISDIPSGLHAYTNRFDWPKRWSGLRERLSTRPNFGQWLRWEAALEEMRAYHSVPASFRHSAFERFTAAATQIIASSPNLRPIPNPYLEQSDEIDDGEMALAKIFPFTLQCNGDAISYDDCVKVYRALNRDMSHLLSANASNEERQLAAQPCHIGQPVGLHMNGQPMAALRISAGARIVSEAWSPDEKRADENIRREIEQVAIICRKIEFLLKHLRKLS
jgi:hypothetical protein